MSHRGSRSCELITIPISHYCEKARWALDRTGVAYRERPHLQMVHWVAVRRAGGGRTVPVLVCGDTVFADSADIVAWADSRAAPADKLFPADSGLASEVRALEREFDERLGPHGRRWMYNEIRGRRDLAMRYALTGVPTWERRAFGVGFQVAMRVIDRYLDITPATATASLGEVRAVFEAVAERLADGRRYLVGDRFTAADLTFAALAGAVLMPPEYSVPLPQPDELPAAMAAAVRELRAHPAGRHALAMFSDER
jgi:glutathione S-transferase